MGEEPSPPNPRSLRGYFRKTCLHFCSPENHQSPTPYFFAPPPPIVFSCCPVDSPKLPKGSPPHPEGMGLGWQFQKQFLRGGNLGPCESCTQAPSGHFPERQVLSLYISRRRDLQSTLSSCAPQGRLRAEDPRTQCQNRSVRGPGLAGGVQALA